MAFITLHVREGFGQLGMGGEDVTAHESPRCTGYTEVGHACIDNMSAHLWRCVQAAPCCLARAVDRVGVNRVLADEVPLGSLLVGGDGRNQARMRRTVLVRVCMVRRH